MRLPNQSSGVARNVGSGVAAKQHTFRALVPAQISSGQAFLRRLPNGGREPNGGPIRISCGPCDTNGFQECSERIGNEPPFNTFTRECTRTVRSCGLIVPLLIPGQPLDTNALQFTQETVRGGRRTTSSCSKCSPETRIDLPWPASDRCIRVCCSGLDPTSCSVSVRTC